MYDCQVVDPRGQKIGSVTRVWLNGQTGDPAWAEVHTGLFGLKETFVPLQRAELHDDQVQVSVAKEKVKDAPRIDVHGDELGNAEQQTVSGEVRKERIDVEDDQARGGRKQPPR